MEMVMAMGNFELPVALFYIDDGVYQLHADIDTSNEKMKSPRKLLGTLKFLEIDQIYACRESLNLRNIHIKSLPDEVILFETQELRDLLDHYEQLIQI